MNASAARSSHNPVDVPVTRLLGQVGAEVTALAEFVEHFQAAVGPLVMQSPARNKGHLREMQGLDALYQKLKALGDFLAVLAPATPEHWFLDPTEALRAVLLADLAARLCAPSDSLDPPYEEGGGDFEMF